MKYAVRTAICLLVAVGQALPQEPGQPTYRVGSQEVLLDLVVRDKKGRTVRDLKPADLEILDDGTPVNLRQLRLVEASAAGAKSARPGPAIEARAVEQKPDPLRQIKLVTLVFERLSLDGRRLFRQAALDMLSAEPSPNLYFSVFMIDNRLNVIQPFTNDRALLRKAVDSTLSGAYSQFASQSADVQRQLESTVQKASEAAEGAEQAASSSRGAGAGGIGTLKATAALAQLQLNMLQFSAQMERDQQSQASLFSMVALVKEQEKLPGRKIVLYFSESFRFSANTAAQMPVLINAANRANVSIYSVDARGLITTTLNSEGNSIMAAAAASSRRQVMAGLSRQAQPVTPDQVRIFDDVTNALGANTQVGLDTIAAGTGGFLISNSNDIRAPVRRALEEVLTYYEAAYVPPAIKLDGHFRSITVRAKRPDITIHTRAGYFALPATVDAPMFPYELPLLEALTRTPVPRAFEYRAGMFRFDPRGNQLQYSLTVEAPIRNLRAVVDKEKSTYKVHASVLALVKAQDGRVVAKLSRDLPFEGPLDRLPAFQNGNLIQSDHVLLPPGRYTLETAISDRNAETVSARRAVLLVPESTQRMALSSLVPIRRLDADAVDDTRNPLHFQGGRVTPTLESDIKGGAAQQLGLYFVVYSADPNAEPPVVLLDVRNNGQAVGAAEVKLPAPDASGRIPYVATIGLDKFQPGDYDVNVSVRQGNLQASEAATLHIR